MKKTNPQLPKKFQKSDKSFLKKLFLEGNQLHGRSFLPFPKQVNFYGKDSDEYIVLIVRSHWIAYLPELFLAFLVILIPLILLPLSFNYPLLGSPVLFMGVLVVAVAVALNILISTIARWYYTVNIITTQRVVVMSLKNAFSHSYSEAQLEKIEDVSHRHMGFIESFFDVGNIEIDTAGHEVDFKLYLIPRPRDVQDTLNDLLEMKQKEDI